MKVFVIDLGSQWGHRIWRTLRDLNCGVEMLPVTTPVKKIKEADALVFSGGALRLGKGEAATAGNCGAYLDEFEGGILGVCAGQQFIALHYGGKVKPARVPEFGKVEITVDERNDLFAGLPKKFIAWASHNDEVSVLPKGFKRLAHSKDCKNHAFKHEKRGLYGTLFHPEVAHTEFGEKIYENFLKACKK